MAFSPSVTVAVLAICFCLLVTLPLTTPFVLSPSVPNRLSEVHGTVGGNVTLRCPVPFKTELVSWTKADEPERDLLLSNRHRFSSRSGFLRIFGLVMADAAEYICTASGGHGPQEERVSLKVHDLSDHSRESLHNDYPEQAETGKPRFPNGKPLSSWFQQPTGATVHFHCEAKGRPVMKVQWLKDHKIIRTKGNYKSRPLWTLTLQDLKEENSGLYTCLVSNDLGTISANFTLKVIGEKPELLGEDPSNTSLAYGNTGTLQCKSRSKTPQQIQWLKRIVDPESVSPEEKPLQFENEFYRVLKNHQSVPLSPLEEGISLSKLQLGPASEDTAGKYVCVAHNVQGLYTYRAVYVEVEGIPGEIGEASTEHYVLISVLVAVFVLVLFILLRFSMTIHKRFCFSKTKTTVPTSEKTLQVQEPLVVDKPSPESTVVSSVLQLGPTPTRHKHYHHHQHRHQHHLLSENGRKYFNKTKTVFI